jgi:pimeloyl-ACP methyl ester carboxylesterase
MAQNSRHSIIVVPGLDDGPDTWLMRLIIQHWSKDGFKIDICRMRWKDSSSYQLKQEKLLRLIDENNKAGYTTSLVGISAGGSAVVNALFARPDIVHKVINICGRLKDGGYLGFRSLERQSRSSPAFRESVLYAQNNLVNANRTHLEKIMTLRARFDELVPSETSLVSGAHNILLPSVEHIFSIIIALVFYRRCIVDFVKS